MKVLLIATFSFIVINSFSQNSVEWDGIYQLQLSDFQSASSQIRDVNMIGIQTAAGMDFSFQMSNAEFMLTKNFNSKVGCSFKRNASSLIAPDSTTANQLVNFARYEFDLSELYARKFRQKLYLGKGAFSSVSFFQPIFNDVQEELNQRHAQAFKETEYGRETEKLKQLHDQVLIEIAELADFCKTCKPVKKKK